MKTIVECVVTAMDGSDTEIYQYLPYILQDIWEIGTDPDVVINMIGKHFTAYEKLRILDLGCGKGAVSIRLAAQLGCHCHGIDAIPEFVDYAKEKAKEYRVEHLCEFELGDIRVKVKTLFNYDIIILGAIGPVFGDYYTTLTVLSECLSQKGIFIIDDGYIESDSDYIHPLIQKRETMIRQIDSAEMQLIEEKIFDKDHIKESDGYIFNCLKKRCFELIDQYPGKKDLFLGYVKDQAEENEVLEHKVICSTMVIKRKLH